MLVRTWADHALQRLQECLAAGPYVRPLQDRKTAVGVSMSPGALVNNKMKCPRMSTNSLPIRFVIHL